MKKITLLLALFLASFFAKAQHYQNAYQFAGDGSSVFSVVVADVLHNNELNITYVTGSFQGTVDFEPGNEIDFKTTTSEAGFLAAYNESGKLLWFKTFIGGYASKPVSLSYGLEAVYVLGQASSSVAKIAAFNKSSGVFIEWSEITSTGTLNVKDICCRKNSTYFSVVGSFSGTLTAESRTLTSNGDLDAFYLNYFKPSLSLFYCTAWANYGGLGADEANALDIESNTSVTAIAGSFSGNADFYMPMPNTLVRISNGGKDSFIMLLNPNENYVTNSNRLLTFGGNSEDIINDVQINSSKVTIGGQFKNTVDFDPSSNTSSLTASGSSFDSFIACYNFDSTNGILYNNLLRPASTALDEFVYKIKTFNDTSNVHFLIQNNLTNGASNVYGYWNLSNNSSNFGFIGLYNGTFYKGSLSLGGTNGEYIYVGGTITETSDLNYDSGVTNLMTHITNGTNGYLLKMGACNLSADTPMLSSSSAPICNGQSKTVTIDLGSKLNNNNEWKWYQSSSFVPVLVGTGSSITLSPTNTTNYFVRGEGGCVANGLNRNFTITVNPLPDATLTVTGNTITSNEAGGAYQWLDCNNGNAQIFGATSQSFTPSSSGSYACLVANIFDCQITTNCVNITVLSTDDFSKLGIKLYPNPVKNSFKIEGDVVIETLSIYDILGQKIKTFTNINTFDIEDLASGTYIVEIISNKGTASTKIIKE